MIIKRILLKNFRQFIGEQEIEFYKNNEQNITVIFGENGRGKTGIFRALMFALYGERKLSQDDDADIDALYLVNTHCIENTDGPVEMYVLLEFEHNNYHYQIKRTILGIKDGKKIVHEEIKHIINVN